MMKYHPSFASKLNRYLLISFAVMYMFAIMNVALISSGLVKRASVRDASNSLQLTVADMEHMLSEVSIPVENMTWLVKEHLDDPDFMYKITSQLVSSNPMIMGSTVAFTGNYFPSKGKYFAPYTCVDSKTGQLLSFQMGDEDYDYFKMEWYSRAATTARSCWSEPYYDEGGGDQMMATFSAPIRDDYGRVIAVITSDISLKDLTERLSKGDTDYSYSFMLSSKGKYISHPDTSLIMHSTVFDVARSYGSSKIQRIGEEMIAGKTGTMDYNYEGDIYIIAYSPLKNGWSAGLVSPRAKLFKSLTEVIRTSLLMIILGFLALAYLGRKIIKRQTQPITQFAYTAQSIAKGNFYAEIPQTDSVEELVHLKQSFEYLEKSINTYITELRATTGTKERLESELGIARNIQLAMIPKVFPDKKRYDLWAAMHAAKEVGGDLFDYVEHDGKLIFAVGDVSGKGVPAALYMAIAKSTFHFFAKSSGDTREVVSTVNNVFSEDNDSGMFATFFVGCIDLATLRMDFCNAGHNPIVVISPEGKAEYLNAKPNLAVGLFENFPYESEYIQLRPGSRILVYTDGVTEAENHDKDQYGEQRLLNYCSTASIATSSSSFIEGLLASVHKFTAGNASNDDITILSIHL